MATTAENPKMFDVGGSAGYLKSLGCDAATPNFIRTLIACGQVAHVKVGKKFYITKFSLDAWLVKAERRLK